MNKVEFEYLSALADNQDFEMSKIAYAFSDNDIHNAISHLEQTGFICHNTITEAGYAALEPYKVKRAVFLAAGFGSRMVPITINTPKPMVKVHGKRIIETIIEAVLAAGINEIFIVRGYLGEQFELLQKKYPMIRLIDNVDYDGTGTISSFYYARDYLSSAYVLESDLVVTNPKVIRKYHYSSDFLGSRTDATDDWFFKTDDKGTIREIGTDGVGDNLYKLVGMSFWSESDGKQLAEDIQNTYATDEGKKLPMSYIPFRLFRDKYQVSIMPCRESDVIEIDSFAELQAYDDKYQIRK